ncbi:glycoside hydrolase family 6 protein [Nonomuraea sp. M3C6]|uniref:Glycoside hydrolase family 6 protein n=1 Tax=Nonomuraea marmarensis TaxID=3351344 RepID=A0ABW7A535_9ACTN
MTVEALRDGDPRQVGPYTLLGRLGEGGMGVVYLGQGPDGTRVAVKLIHARMDANADFRRRFAREVAAAKRVARFCTAPVLDADVQGDVAYLVTEYVEGPSLGDAVRESGPLKGSALDGLAASMAMALRAIHGAGVVHRDLKPSNVLLSQVGPKVIDFGIAQLVDAEMSSAIVGTPAYMSPEQVSGAHIGPASDIFAWGGTVAFAAGGVPPFGSGSVPTILVRILNEAPNPRGLTGPLRDLVVASLAKNPADRPTAQDLMDHLSTSPPPPEARPLGAGAAGLGAAGASPASGPAHPAGGRAADHPPSAGTAQPGATGSAGALPGAAGARGAEPDTAESRSAPRQRRLVAAAAAIVVAIAGISAAVAWRNQGTPSSAQTSTAKATPAHNSTSQNSATATTPQNPLRAQGKVTFYAPEEPAATRQAALWEKDRPADAELMRKLAAVPFAIRLNQPDARPEVADTITAAQGGVPVFLINSMPGSDCRPFSASDMDEYQEWIKGIASEIGGAKAVVILEPSSLVKIPGAKDCALKGSPDQRYEDLREAVQSLKANPATAVYLDGSQDYWPGTEIMAERLIRAGVDKADGFFINSTGYQATGKSVGYGKALAACVSIQRSTGKKDCPSDAKVDTGTMPHFVIDTSRNGQGSWAPAKKYPDPQTWCNPPGRGVGERPTTDTGEERVDAYLWIARPGTSSGRCRRGTGGQQDPERGVVSPEAGQWWGDLALERAKNANPPLN